MERNHEDQPIVDLGAASAETRGSVGKFEDEQSTRILPGLSDD